MTPKMKHRYFKGRINQKTKTLDKTKKSAKLQHKVKTYEN